MRRMIGGLALDPATPNPHELLPSEQLAEMAELGILLVIRFFEFAFDLQIGLVLCSMPRPADRQSTFTGLSSHSPTSTLYLPTQSLDQNSCMLRTTWTW